MNLRAILSDFDGVLRRWDPGPARAAEAEAGLEPDALAAAAFAPELLLPAIRGEVADATWRARIAMRLAEQVGPERAEAAVAAWSESCGAVDPEVHELLARARPACTLVLVTNATTRLASDLARLGLEGFFHAVVSSAELGCEKPRAEIYRAALERAGVAASEALFVDDQRENVAAAADLGLAAHHFTEVGPLAALLSEAGLSGGAGAQPFDSGQTAR